jgi:hypothetical protein
MSNKNEKKSHVKYKYLFCPAAQKSGTTYLYNLLNQYDEVCFSSNKELGFFRKKNDIVHNKQNYESNFRPGPKAKYLADFFPIYLTDDYAIEEIKTCCQDEATFIIILRDPIKRAFSNYRMHLIQNIENRSFHEVVMEEIRGDSGFNGILKRSSYYEQLSRLRRFYSMEKIHIEEFSSFISCPEKAVERICEFLGLDNKKLNYRVGKFRGADRRIAGLGRVLYNIPYRKKELIVNSRFLNLIYRGIIFATRRKLKEPPVIEQKTIDVLNEYFEESNKLLKEEYDIDTSKWT